MSLETVGMWAARSIVRPRAKSAEPCEKAAEPREADITSRGRDTTPGDSNAERTERTDRTEQTERHGQSAQRYTGPVEVFGLPAGAHPLSPEDLAARTKVLAARTEALATRDELLAARAEGLAACDESWCVRSGGARRP